eukprot:PhM_4_TR15905/c1_g1_i1/m.32475
MPASVTAQLRGAYAAEALLRSRPEWFMQPPPPSPPGSHSAALQPRVELRRLHANLWRQLSTTPVSATPHLRPWATAFVDLVSFGTHLPPALSLEEKLHHSLHALSAHRDSFATLAIVPVRRRYCPLRSSKELPAPTGLAAHMLTATELRPTSICVVPSARRPSTATPRHHRDIGDVTV